MAPVSKCSYCDVNELVVLPEIINIEGDNRPYLNVDVMGFEFEGLLDSGASCTIIGKDGLDLIRKLSLSGRPTKIATRTADGTVHMAVCSVDVAYKVYDKVCVLSTLVVPSLSKMLILGMDFWNVFNIKPCIELECAVMEGNNIDSTENNYQINLNKEELARLDLVIKKFHAATDSRIGCTNIISHEIDTGNAKPVVKRAYQVSPYIQKGIDAELDRMVKLDVIETSKSDWANPIVAVRKSNGRIRLFRCERVERSNGQGPISPPEYR